jgi:hypothetical protein
MLSKLSRRLFLIRTAWGLAGVAVVRIGIQFRRPVCRCCGVRARVHRCKAGGYAGSYCANCGVNVETGHWDLDVLESANTGAPPDVPFPNPSLVKSGVKPAVSLRNVRL